MVTGGIINQFYRQPAMTWGSFSETAQYQMQAEMRKTRDALQTFQEEQKKATEQLQQLVSQTQSIGKAVTCGERRQDAYSGAVSKYLMYK